MTQTLTVSAQDVVSAQRLHATPKPLLSASLLILTTGGIVVAYAESLLSPGGAFGAVLGMFGWLAVQFLVTIPYLSRRIYLQQKSLHIEHQFEWDDQFVYFHSQDTEGKMRWSDFTKFKENRNMLLLYHSDSLYNMMPKRCFSSHETFEDFKSHLSSVQKG